MNDGEKQLNKIDFSNLDEVRNNYFSDRYSPKAIEQLSSAEKQKLYILIRG